MDEASQVSLPISLGAILKSKRFILVGDHYQLSPMVKSPVAREENLGDSLFVLLLKNNINNREKETEQQHPSSIMSVLRLQYRMNAELMELSNKFIYNGLLLGGSEKVLASKLAIVSSTEDSVDCPQWIYTVLQKNR